MNITKHLLSFFLIISINRNSNSNSNSALFARPHIDQIIIPAIAKFSTIIVGKTSEDNAWKMLGKGLVSTGDHPNSGQSWYLVNQHAILSVGGWAYRPYSSYIVDILDISNSTSNLSRHRSEIARLPHVHISNSKLVYLSSIQLGQVYNNVWYRLKKYHPVVKYSRQNKYIQIEEKGFSKVTGTTTYVMWHVTFSFHDKKLDEIEITAYGSAKSDC